MEFEDLSLSKEIKKSLKEMNYITMTPIQEKVFDAIVQGKNIMATSNTGTGKTLAFLLPLIEKIDVDINSTQILILVPTRELAIQIENEIKTITKYKNEIDYVSIVGGRGIKEQAILLRKNKKIVVGTPGRILKLLSKKILNLNKLKSLVLDEADEMLLMGFEKEIYKINKYINRNVQKLMFSATIMQNMKELSKKILYNPLIIECIQNKSIISNNLKQIAIEIKEKMKNECTLRILKSQKYNNSIIFCNTKKKTLEVSKYLKENGIKLEMLNSDIMQNQREKIFKKLKEGKLETIVVTDLLSRGIDIDNLELVINYDIPIDVNYYIHRVGRTARNGRSGVAYTFYIGKQSEKIREIENFTNTKFEYEDIPILKNKYSENIKFITINDDGFYLVKLNVGKNDNIKAKDIIGALCALVGISSSKVGKIQVEDSITYVEIPPEYISDVIAKFENGKIKGKDVSIIYEKNSL
mgnify:CR=1 FL=1